jgi:hypothetical protein
MLDLPFLEGENDDGDGGRGNDGRRHDEGHHVKTSTRTMAATDTRYGRTRATGTMVVDPTSTSGSMMIKINIYPEVPICMVSLPGREVSI